MNKSEQIKDWFVRKLVGHRDWENDPDRRVEFFAERCSNIETWDSSDLWDLRVSLAQTIYKRLEAFGDGMGHSYLSGEEWTEVLYKMRFGFWFYGWEQSKAWTEFVNSSPESIQELWTRADEGTSLFGEHFGNLWT